MTTSAADVITGLLRGRYGFDGVDCTGFNAITGNHIPGSTTLPPRLGGVEELSVAEQAVLPLDARADRLGGETDLELVLDAARSGAVSEARVDESARRILRDKFRLGLCDDPDVNPDAATERVGAPAPVELGRRVQQRSLIHLAGQRLYTEGIDPAVAARYSTVVERAEDAAAAIVRSAAPYEKREGFMKQFRGVTCQRTQEHSDFGSAHSDRLSTRPR
ncbi:hypothetical protein ACFTXM_22955 [Streptomyces sp. NPDC056930]|uniref:hypothetical protein n=1 Tax=Streptomyces sp. NPDC056930 TaxID=3345967 RepID=UPI003638D54A